MAGHVDHTIDVAASMDLVWRLTNDVMTWPWLFTEYAEAEVLHRDGDTVRFRLVTRPDESGAVRSWVSERTADPSTRTVHARRTSELGPFEYMNIYWEYHEVPGGVRMRWVQDFHVRAGLPFGDDEMAEHLSSNTRIQMDSVKKQLERVAAESVPT
jgi:aromatase